jgi:integrase/FtsZ-binding cell division protein ZapB
VMPIFCYWEDKTPDEIIKERDEQLNSLDRKKRYYYEDRMDEFKQYLVDNHYGSGTIKNYLSRVAGFFSNNRLDLNLDNTFWKKADKSASELVQATETTKRYPDNDEIRLIIELAPNHQTLTILFGYQCGLTPSDIVSLTWERLNIDFENEKRDFIHVENQREKTGALHVFILNPDLLHYLRAHWTDTGKPSSGWIFEGYKGSSMTSRNLNAFFKELSVKALGENRGTELVFKDLRDSYNEAILDSDVNEEIKDTLMGHLRKSAKANYSISIGTLVRTYREKIFPRLAVNGWRLKQEASKVDRLRVEVEGLKNALKQVEGENASYKTRIDNLQEQVTALDKELKKSQEEMRSTTASHTILINRIIEKGDFDFKDIPTEEEVEKKLKDKS